MDMRDGKGRRERKPELPETTEGEELEGEEPEAPRAPRVERARPKVSLLGAIVVNLVTLVTLAIVMLAILLPGYRRSFTMSRAVKGAESVWVVVRISQSQLEKNGVKFEDAQESVKRTLEELVGAGEAGVYIYVRDSYPPKTWVQDYLPEDMQKWLEELYPKQPNLLPRLHDAPEGETPQAGAAPQAEGSAPTAG